MVDDGAEGHIVVFHVYPTTHTVDKTVGLFEYLLQHKMRITALLYLS